MDEVARLVQEVADRSRRIETRLTRFLEASGFETGARKPVFVRDAIELPSLMTSFSDCLLVVPSDWDRDEELAVRFQGRTVGYILLP